MKCSRCSSRPFGLVLGLLLQALVLVAVATVSPPSHAQAEQRAIAYQGTLEHDGQPVNGIRQLVFKLFDAPTDGTQIGSDINATVTVYGGAFATVLAPIPVEAFTRTHGLYLEIAVEGKTLQGRQRIRSVPFALGTSRGDDMVVTGSLGIGGAAPSDSAALVVGSGDDGQGGSSDTLFAGSTIDIPLGDEAAGGMVLRDAQDADQRAELTYSSGDNWLRLHNQGKGLNIDKDGHLVLSATDLLFGANSGRGDGGRAMVHDINDTLVLNYNGDFSGGTRVDGNAKVGGDLTIGGSLKTGNTGCRADNCTSWIDVAGGENWGSWRGRTYCPAHQYVCGLDQKVEGNQGSNGDDTAVNDIAIICCPF